jgi:hypothetical protein
MGHVISIDAGGLEDTILISILHREGVWSSIGMGQMEIGPFVVALAIEEHMTQDLIISFIPK